MVLRQKEGKVPTTGHFVVGKVHLCNLVSLSLVDELMTEPGVIWHAATPLTNLIILPFKNLYVCTNTNKYT